MEQVIVRFSKGKATIETTGFVGTSCQDVTADLERRLGHKTDDQPTDALYKSVEIDQQQSS